MSRSHLAQDIRRVLNGLAKVANASVCEQQIRCETIVKNSSVLKGAREVPEAFRKVSRTDEVLVHQ